MDLLSTKNQEMIDFIDSLTKWHSNRVDQLKLIVEKTDADIDVSGQRIPKDSDIAQGIRLGVQVALMQMGKLPFTIEKTELEGDIDNSNIIELYQCCECKWEGSRDQKKQIPSDAFKDIGVSATDYVCPKCGHNEFYSV